jgi:hypothetical protein
MNILAAVFGKTKKITSTAIAAEIEKARKEHDDALTKRGAGLAGLSLMDDDQHKNAEAQYEAHRRAADRALARVADLEKAHAEAVATEAAEAERQAAEQFRQRVEAARNAVEREGSDLLDEYDNLASRIADIVAKLAKIDTEAKACDVHGVDQTHRRHPDRHARERREKRLCWVFRYPASPPDQPGDSGLKYLQETAREEVREATINPDTGKAIPTPSEIYDYYGRTITIVPTLEEREIVVERVRFSAGRLEYGLTGVVLPPGRAGGSFHWPRKS